MRICDSACVTFTGRLLSPSNPRAVSPNCAAHSSDDLYLNALTNVRGKRIEGLEKSEQRIRLSSIQGPKILDGHLLPDSLAVLESFEELRIVTIRDAQKLLSRLIRIAIRNGCRL